MAYSKGVLMHNFNEDRYGIDLQSSQRIPPFVNMSVSHTVHNWKTPSIEMAEGPTPSVDRHILFGHTGDMRDPHTNLQKTEFAPASLYFLQDPAHIKEVGTLTADGYTISGDPLAMIGGRTNHHVSKLRQSWGDGRQSHALPPSDRFQTENKRSFAHPKEQGEVEQAPRVSRPYDEFTRQYDAVRLTRNLGRTGGGLRSAASLMMQ